MEATMHELVIGTLAAMAGFCFAVWGTTQREFVGWYVVLAGLFGLMIALGMTLILALAS